jgi:mono/diheme cytochrome c family protein
MAQRSSVQRGDALVIQHCAMCHGMGSSETSPNPMARSFRAIVRDRPIDSLEELLRNGALFGHPMMPGFELSPRDVNAIVRYLRSIQSR